MVGFERNGIGGANAILGTTKQARARAAKAFTPLEYRDGLKYAFQVP